MNKKYKVWIISRIDQVTLLARHLKNNNQLVRWDSFIRISNNSFLSKIFFKGTRRLIDSDLVKVPGNHFFPEIVGNILKFFRYKEYTKIQDLILAKISAQNIPKEFDILHGQGNYSLESGLIAKKKGKIFISEVSGQMGKTRFDQLNNLYKKFNLPLDIGIKKLQQRRLKEAEIADAIICPSEIVLKELVKLGIKKEKIYIANFDTPISKDLLKINPKLKGQDKKFIILFVGQISINKGVHHAISIQKKLLKEGINCELHLVGKVIHKFLKKNTDKKKIIFYDQVYKEKLIHLYSVADIFLFPSYSEGSALTTYEAMASGLPVITTEAAASIVENGYSGFVCKNEDEEEMYKTTYKLATDQELRNKISINAKKSYLEKMKKSYGEKITDIYEHLLNKKC